MGVVYRARYEFLLYWHAGSREESPFLKQEMRDDQSPQAQALFCGVNTYSLREKRDFFYCRTNSLRAENS